MSNVLNYGADPTGVNDSTSAFQAAIAATPVSGTVCAPVVSAGYTYKLQADQIDLAGRRLLGDYAHSSQRTTLVAGTAGTALILGSSECAIERLAISAAGVSYGLQLVGADRSIIKSVEVVNATSYGVLLQDCLSLYVEGIYSHTNANGMRILGCDGSTLLACAANNNTNVGLYLAGVGSGLTAQLGSIAWFGGAFDLNTGGPQCIMDGVEQAVLNGIYVEGQSPGLLMQNECANNDIQFLRFVSGDTAADYAIDIQSGNKNTFEGCSAGGVNSRRVRMMEGATEGNTFFGCFRASYLAVDYMTLVFDDGGGGTYTFEQNQSGPVAVSVPNHGTWKEGDIVMHAGVGAPNGWRCTVAGTPGTWVTF